ncbi:hypothetical protein [Massilia eurypsychrophila]|jgi:hypothetical protein|uniref:hypothetical protein n=1 Tax=Massilia eurypsychrophila TaxID=1485217 RepID=UPI0015D4E43B|nr:hypothetical protein [Massilia eurypsychrophila]
MKPRMAAVEGNRKLSACNGSGMALARAPLARPLALQAGGLTGRREVDQAAATVVRCT